MNELNGSLFLLVNASTYPNSIWVTIAKFFAEDAIFLIPITLVIGWLRGGESARKLMLVAAASGLAGLLIAQLIGLVWKHPRPFMLGLGNQLIPHVADSSFPSDHLTLLWSVTFSFVMHLKHRAAGILCTLLGLPVAWARIYLGVHFPLDMLGAIAVALFSAWLCFREEQRFIEPVYTLTHTIYARLFARLIRGGWVLK